MPYEFYNPNPKNQKVGDCAVRAICKALGTDWQDAYISLCAEGLYYKDMPSSNYVWGNYLKRFGFIEHIISSVCPNCITVSEFAKDHPEGILWADIPAEAIPEEADIPTMTETSRRRWICFVR